MLLKLAVNAKASHKKIEGSELRQPLVSPELYLFWVFFFCYLFYDLGHQLFDQLHSHTQKKKKRRADFWSAMQWILSDKEQHIHSWRRSQRRHGPSLDAGGGGLSWTQSAGSIVWTRSRRVISHAVWKKSPRSILWMIRLVEIVVTSRGNFLLNCAFAEMQALCGRGRCVTRSVRPPDWNISLPFGWIIINFFQRSIDPRRWSQMTHWWSSHCPSSATSVYPVHLPWWIGATFCTDRFREDEA